MEFLVIAASLACVALSYTYVSLRDGSFINVLTPTIAFLIPANYLLEMYHIWLFGPSNTLYAYTLIYACYAATFGAFALSYALTAVPAFRLPFTTSDTGGNRLMPYLVLVAAIALYWPVLSEFRGALANPREIYEQTRSGYGVFFFLSTTLCYLALVLLLFKRRLGKLELAVFSLICLVFLWLHGSKNQMLLTVFIVTTYWVYVRGKRVSLGKFALFGALLAPIGLGLFLITNPLLILGQQGLMGIASYSEYTRNGMLVIDSGFGPTYGRLTLEGEIYARIPRPLYPDKPNDFGVIYLAEHFFPSQYAMDQGAPAFSFGTMLADFGAFALPLLLLANIASGVLLKVFVTGLRRYRDPGNFTLVLFGSGLALIPASPDSISPESFMLAILINLLYSIRSRPKRRQEPTPPVTAPGVG